MFWVLVSASGSQGLAMCCVTASWNPGFLKTWDSNETPWGPHLGPGTPSHCSPAEVLAALGQWESGRGVAGRAEVRVVGGVCGVTRALFLSSCPVPMAVPDSGFR